MKKLSINEIRQLNDEYAIKSLKLDEMLNNLKEKNELIDLEEVENTFNYQQTKELYTSLRFYFNYDSKTKHKLEYLMNTKKEQEYSQILGIHYYPVLFKVDFMTEDDKKTIDKTLCTLSNRHSYFTVYDLLNNQELIDFLLQHKIIEKYYLFECGMNKELISEERKQQFYDFHNFNSDIATDEEINNHMGCYEQDNDYFYVGYDDMSDEELEITNIQQFEENQQILYKVIQKPDMTWSEI